ncbi:unnamed protein product [Alopecurus aequalis]
MGERSAESDSDCLVLAKVTALSVLGMAAIMVLAYTTASTPPEFSATVSGYDIGLLQGAGAAAEPPSFRVALRVKNGDMWRHCFEAHSAVVEYEGVPLASADLHRFCVRPRSVVEVPVLAAGEGPGIPDQLYESIESRRQRQERVSLEVRLVLQEMNTVPAFKMMLLRCTAMLDGRPRCLVFFFVDYSSIPSSY